MDADGDAMPCWDGWDNWGEHDAFPTSLNHIEGDGSNNGTWELDRGESDLDGLPCSDEDMEIKFQHWCLKHWDSILSRFGPEPTDKQVYEAISGKYDELWHLFLKEGAAEGSFDGQDIEDPEGIMRMPTLPLDYWKDPVFWDYQFRDSTYDPTRPVDGDSLSPDPSQSQAVLSDDDLIETPPPQPPRPEVVTPMAKIQLAAAKRAAANKKNKAGESDAATKKIPSKASAKAEKAKKAAPKAHPKATPKVKAKAAAKSKSQKQDSSRPKGETEYGAAKKEFVAKIKLEQPELKAKQIHHLWMQSDERKAIVDKLPESEIKRRRY